LNRSLLLPANIVTVESTSAMFTSSDDDHRQHDVAGSKYRVRCPPSAKTGDVQVLATQG
jgi:hypothetical protein